MTLRGNVSRLDKVKLENRWMREAIDRGREDRSRGRDLGGMQ